MRVIVAGGRDFKKMDFMFSKLDKILFNQGENVEIVSGGQVTIDEKTGNKWGADYFGEMYATTYRHCKLTVFKAEWGKYGNFACPLRNKQMAEYSDALIAFWNGKSKGTKNMIEEAKVNGLKVRIITYDTI